MARPKRLELLHSDSWSMSVCVDPAAGGCRTVPCTDQLSGQRNWIADRVAGFKEAHRKKIEVAKWTRELDLPLTVNAVMHRQNLYQISDIIHMAVDLDADRLEVANVQYYGWALKNRAALMPTFAQLEKTNRIVEEAQARLKGVLTIDYVIPDYYALRPKKCMGGRWHPQCRTSRVTLPSVVGTTTGPEDPSGSTALERYLTRGKNRNPDSLLVVGHLVHVQREC